MADVHSSTRADARAHAEESSLTDPDTSLAPSPADTGTKEDFGAAFKAFAGTAPSALVTACKEAAEARQAYNDSLLPDYHPDKEALSNREAEAMETATRIAARTPAELRAKALLVNQWIPPNEGDCIENLAASLAVDVLAMGKMKLDGDEPPH